jgi:hypothetical protein
MCSKRGSYGKTILYAGGATVFDDGRIWEMTGK